MSNFSINWNHRPEPRREGDYMRTRSGIKFYTLDPVPGDFNIVDTAYGLSNAARWGGQCDFYSVAQHAVRCAETAIALKLPNVSAYKMLHHDDSEGYMADLTRPLKKGLPDYKRVEANLMLVAGLAYGFTWPLTPEEHELDTAMMIVESRFLFPNTTREDFPDDPTIQFGVIPNIWTPEETRNRYLSLHERLKPCI